MNECFPFLFFFVVVWLTKQNLYKTRQNLIQTNAQEQLYGGKSEGDLP